MSYFEVLQDSLVKRPCGADLDSVPEYQMSE